MFQRLLLVLVFGLTPIYCAGAAKAISPTEQIVVFSDFFDRVHVVENGCPGSARLVHFNTEQIELALSKAALRYFERSGRSGAIAQIARQPSERALVQALREKYPGSPLLILVPGAYANPYIRERARSKSDDVWFTGGCKMIGAGFFRTPAGQASSVFTKVLYFPAGSSKPAIRDFTGMGPAKLEATGEELGRKVEESDLRRGFEFYSNNVPDYLSVLLNAYFRHLESK